MMGIILTRDPNSLQTPIDQQAFTFDMNKVSKGSIVKLLLLGPAESGKSTVLKQMRILHANKFTPVEKSIQRRIIQDSVLKAVLVLVDAMSHIGVKYGDIGTESDACLLKNMTRAVKNVTMTTELSNALQRLWKDKGIRECFKRRNEYNLALDDSIEYFLDEISRVGKSDYDPTTEDILRSRVPTTGIVETAFIVKGFHFRIFDMGGQRSERRKWIHCFDDVKGVLFVVAMSEYDKVLMEDGQTNRIHDSVRLFKSVCNSSFLKTSSMIVLLNKKDLLAEKLTKVPFTVTYPDYKGAMTTTAVSEYLKELLISQNLIPEKMIYSHVTCATDTGQIKFVLDATTDMLISENLKQNGIL